MWLSTAGTEVRGMSKNKCNNLQLKQYILILKRAKAFRTWAVVFVTLFYEVLLNPRLMSRLGELYKPLFRLFSDDMTLYRGYRNMCMPKNDTRGETAASEIPAVTQVVLATSRRLRRRSSAAPISMNSPNTIIVCNWSWSACILKISRYVTRKVSCDKSRPRNHVRTAVETRRQLLKEIHYRQCVYL